jgi:hypothetical protein
MYHILCPVCFLEILDHTFAPRHTVLPPKPNCLSRPQKVVEEMNRLGMMIDLSHASDTLVKQTLEVSQAPVIFSHSAARSVCDNLLNIPDDILQLLVSGVAPWGPQTQD